MKKSRMAIIGMLLLVLRTGLCIPVFAQSCGDVNDDGIVNIIDALQVVRYYIGLHPQVFYESAADVNADTAINILDALIIAQYYVGIIDELHCEQATPEPGPTPADTSFSLRAKYTSIRSYPGGGGIFIIALEPETNFTGDVTVSFRAEDTLHASLDRNTLDRENRVAELTISPSLSTRIGEYAIDVQAADSVMTKNTGLSVDVMSWETGDPADALVKLLNFQQWLDENAPGLNLNLDMKWTYYKTYPETLIVEHWTFLDNTWEIRLCFHVMIPPDDWSRLWVRKRGDMEATLALYRETEDTGIVHETDISEYPIMYGY
ncbi:MAG: dockerin type I repeat-containing protein [Spirochaetales bacterium]|nr:dockerin type I repeat-containing protein [Spirochaetales bacterium]